MESCNIKKIRRQKNMVYTKKVSGKVGKLKNRDRN